jgi:DNA-binding CsgD family transcriptional regulator
MTSGDWRRCAEFLQELAFTDREDSLAGTVLSGLKRLLDYDFGSWNLLTRELQLIACDMLPEAREGGAFQLPAWERYWQAHPLPKTLESPGLAGRSHCLSDFFATQEHYEQSALYRDFRKLKARFQLFQASRPWTGGVLAIALNRADREWTWREREMLEFTFSAITEAFKRLHLRAQVLPAAQDSPEDWARMDITPWFQLSPNLSIRKAGPAGWGLLKTFKNYPLYSGQLPQPIHQWLQQLPPFSRFGPRHPGTALYEHSIAIDGTVYQLHCCLTLEQDILLFVRPKHPLPGPSPQAGLLTARETEIWNWMAQGKTNLEISLILNISPRTADKHCENLFRKLGVENRLAAILLHKDANSR